VVIPGRIIPDGGILIEEQGDPSIPHIDVSRPSVARMYDYYLGGKDNYRVDREAVDRVAEAMPEIRQLAQENRAFLRRAVRYMARQGIRQFIDIGSGLPTAGNTHEIAQEVVPGARVVYVDNDPVVLAHGRALLASDDNTAVATADMHRPAEVLQHQQTNKLIDFNEPVGVLMIAMVHFLTVDERPAVMGHLRDALAPGSHLAATHVTTDGKSAEAVAKIEAVYATTPTPIYFRDRAEVGLFFDGFDLVEPGLVTLEGWHPDPADPAPEATKWLYGAVGRKN
jgi:O-methyltransferase involved in polyketide biosynthesis